MRKGVVCATCTPATDAAEAVPNAGAANIKTTAIPAALSAFTYCIDASPQESLLITLGTSSCQRNFLRASAVRSSSGPRRIPRSVGCHDAVLMRRPKGKASIQRQEAQNLPRISAA